MLKKFSHSLWEVIKIAVIAGLIVLPIRYFLFQPFVVRGSSMEPNFDSSDYLIVDQLSYRFSSPKRGQVIVFNYPRNQSQRFIKRIIGLPNETIKSEDGNIVIYKNDSEKVLDESDYLRNNGISEEEKLFFSLEEDEYLVLGDNRDFSSDSRQWGPVKEEDIIGRVIVRIFPFNNFSKIVNPAY